MRELSEQESRAGFLSSWKKKSWTQVGPNGIGFAAFYINFLFKNERAVLLKITCSANFFKELLLKDFFMSSTFS